VCGYRGKSETWTEKWTDRHRMAWRLVKAVKGEYFSGETTWTIGSKKFEVANNVAGRAAALALVAGVISSKLTKAGYTDARLIPIPASKHVVLGADFTGARLAAAIQAHKPRFRALPVMTFDDEQPSTRNGGSRKAHEILPHLRCAEVGEGPPIVLIDDVMTGGGHLRAGARKLLEQGIEVADACVVGRTVWEPPVNGMFKIEIEELAI
jgi:hypothetical protein